MMSVEELRKVIIDNFGSFEEFKQMSWDAFEYIENHVSEYSTDTLKEIRAECEVQMLIPSWHAKSRWMNLHRLINDELFKRPTSEKVEQ